MQTPFASQSAVRSRRGGGGAVRLDSGTVRLQVYTVVKATLDKLALVGVINVDMQEQAMTLTRSVGEEIAVKIRLQRALEVEFQQLIEQQHQLRKQSNLIKKEVRRVSVPAGASFSNAPPAPPCADGLSSCPRSSSHVQQQILLRVQENEANIKVVAAKLRASIEALCDKLKDNPNVAENMAKVASERQGLQGLLAKCLEELITMRRVPCVTEAVLAEHYRRKEIKEVSEREKTAGRAVATLRMELRDERDDHEQVCRSERYTPGCSRDLVGAVMSLCRSSRECRGRCPMGMDRCTIFLSLSFILYCERGCCALQGTADPSVDELHAELSPMLMRDALGFNVYLRKCR